MTRLTHTQGLSEMAQGHQQRMETRAQKHTHYMAETGQAPAAAPETPAAPVKRATRTRKAPAA
jgi:hypothetical protein